MFVLYKLIGSLIVPPGLFCVVLLICSGAAFCRPRRKILATFLLLFSFVLWFLSTPLGSLVITGPIEDRYSSEKLPDVLPRAAVIVFGGGLSYDGNGEPAAPGVFAFERVPAGMSAARRFHCPLIFTGGSVFGKDKKTEAQIMSAAARKIGWTGETFLEDRSRTTKENMKNTWLIVKKYGFKNIVLVTSAFHLPRAAAQAARYLKGAALYPLASGRLTRPGFHGVSDLLPDSGSLMVSCMGIKERVGMFALKLFQTD